jgi:hypothetical protein
VVSGKRGRNRRILAYVSSRVSTGPITAVRQARQPARHGGTHLTLLDAKAALREIVIGLGLSRTAGQGFTRMCARTTADTLEMRSASDSSPNRTARAAAANAGESGDYGGRATES